MTPLVNGIAYDYTQIAIRMFGEEVAGVTSISYTEEQTKENNFGTGNRPVSRGRGAINASASITVSMNDIEALRDIAEEGSLLNLAPFDIQVTYLNNQKVVTHILKNCEFTSDGVEASQDDKDISRSFDLVVSHIKYR